MSKDKDKPVTVLIIAETWWAKGATVAEALAAGREAFPGLTSKGQRHYEAWTSADPDATVAEDGSIRSRVRPDPLREVRHGKDVTDAAAMLARRYPPPQTETCATCKVERPAKYGARLHDGTWQCERCQAWAGAEAEPDPPDTPADVAFRQGLSIDPLTSAKTPTWIARRGDRKASGRTKADALKALLPSHLGEWGKRSGKPAMKHDGPLTPFQERARLAVMSRQGRTAASEGEVKAYCIAARAKGLSRSKALNEFREGGKSFCGGRFRSVWNEVSK